MSILNKIEPKIPVVSKLNSIKILAMGLIILFFGTIAFADVFYFPVYPSLLIFLPFMYKKASVLYVVIGFLMLVFSIMSSLMFSGMNFPFALMSISYFMLSVFTKSVSEKFSKN